MILRRNLVLEIWVGFSDVRTLDRFQCRQTGLHAPCLRLSLLKILSTAGISDFLSQGLESGIDVRVVLSGDPAAKSSFGNMGRVLGCPHAGPISALSSEPSLCDRWTGRAGGSQPKARSRLEPHSRRCKGPDSAACPRTPGRRVNTNSPRTAGKR